MFSQRDLIYIKTVVETKNITDAAKKLFVSQPSLSQSIQKIEDKLGKKLFIRHRAGVEITEAGQIYYEMAIQMLDIYTDMENKISDIESLKKGSISIGCSSHMGSVVFPAVIPDFMKDYPNINISIKEDSSRNMQNRLTNLELDLAIMHYNPMRSSKDLDYFDLTRDRFIIIGQKNGILKQYMTRKEGEYYINLNDVKDESFVLLPKGRGIREITDLITDSSGVVLNVKLESINFMTNIELAKTGTVLSIVPYHYFNIYKLNRDDLDWAYIDNPHAYWNSCIATSKDTYKSAALKEITKRIKTYFSKAEII